MRTRNQEFISAVYGGRQSYLSGCGRFHIHCRGRRQEKARPSRWGRCKLFYNLR